MTYADTIAAQFPFRRYFTYSICVHVSITVIALLGIWIERSANPWGGIGGGDSGVKVSLVSSAGIPMPQPTNAT